MISLFFPGILLELEEGCLSLGFGFVFFFQVKTQLGQVSEGGVAADFLRHQRVGSES